MLAFCGSRPMGRLFPWTLLGQGPCKVEGETGLSVASLLWMRLTKQSADSWNPVTPVSEMPSNAIATSSRFEKGRLFALSHDSNQGRGGAASLCWHQLSRLWRLLPQSQADKSVVTARLCLGTSTLHATSWTPDLVVAARSRSAGRVVCSLYGSHWLLWPLLSACFSDR